MINIKNMFLPITKEEMKQRGWDQTDIVLVTGDAYVDHPAFGTAIIARVLESNGFRVGIIPMPDVKSADSIDLFGRPGLFFGVTGGAIDSMLAKYTAMKRYRSDDPYAPGGKAHKPERALITYCNLIKKKYKNVPIVIGGIEASMRRIPHYDFWDGKVRRSIIEDCRANILVYGMGESQILEIAKRISSGKNFIGIQGTVVLSKEMPTDALILPDAEEAMANKKSFIELYRLFYLNQNKTLVQKTHKRYLVHYPPADITSEKLNAIYELPYMRLPHPVYKETIPAFEMIKNSVSCHRGCVSGCSFCSLSLHQGKKIVSRSKTSVLNEVEIIATDKYFKGNISDIGGPSANMYGFECSIKWQCKRESCTHPSLCANLVSAAEKWIDLLSRATDIKRIKKVTVGSGIRYDILMKDPDYKAALKAIVKSHISGQLKIAPEHTSELVLRAMRKLPVYSLKEFINIFRQYNKNAKKKQYLIPYLMSCHPACTINEMKRARDELVSAFGFLPEQVQMFIPLPMTLSSVIYYTGIDPLSEEHFPVVRDMNDRRKQHAVFFN